MGADFSAFRDSELEKFILHHAKLAPGDKLEGKVIEVRADGKALIDFRGFRALAETEITVERGDIIRVEVVARAPKLRLRLERSKKPQGVSEDARQVIQHIQQMDGRSGDNWFHVQALLKELLGGSTPAAILFPADIGKELEQGNQTVKFNIPAEDPQTLSLLLDTGRLGRIRVDFRHISSEGKLNITFFVKDPAAQQPLEANLAQVRRNLDRRFQHLVLQVIHSPVKVGEFDTGQLEQQTGSTGVLDVKV
jgi:hypothetical protein